MRTSSNPPALSVVIPAYNEEQRLPDTLSQILAYLDRQAYRSEIIVADDGSTDKTAQMCDEALVLMGRIGRSDRLDEQLVEVG